MEVSAMLSLASRTRWMLGGLLLACLVGCGPTPLDTPLESAAGPDGGAASASNSVSSDTDIAAVSSSLTGSCSGKSDTVCGGFCDPGVVNCTNCQCTGDKACCLADLALRCPKGSAPACDSTGKCDCFKGLVAFVNSCASRCGNYDPTKACQCDNDCNQFGDCCADKAASCPAYSCVGRCGVYDGSKPCQCDSQCGTYGDCCGDQGRVCACSCGLNCALTGTCCKTCL
jgi:hypothetical protein